ncbi:Transposon Tf2-9 polyprotein, partial [Dictyocoela muelleri]
NKIHSKSLSLYNQLLFFGRVSPESVKLNSTRKENSVKEQDNDFIPQRIEFTHSPKNTTISIKRSFSMLEDLWKQDLFQWRNEFIKTAQLANWDELTALEVLKSSVDTQYFDIIKTAETVETAIKMILQQKYPRNHYLRYLNMLSNTRQDNYLTIKEYKEEINIICERLQICMQWTDEQRILKSEEAFYNGLSKRTQLEMSRLNVQTISDIYHMINCTEETLMEHLANDKEELKKGGSFESVRKNSKQQKHCSYHGYCNHYSSECNAMKQRKHEDHNNLEYSRNNKNLVMKSANTTPRVLQLPVLLNNNQYMAVFDSGSSYNYISNKLVNNHNLYTSQIHPINAELVDGATVTSLRETSFNLILGGEETKSYTIRAKVLEKMNPDIILGMEFLMSQKAKIDFENMKIELSSSLFEFRNDEEQCEMDNKILNKTKIYCQLKTELSSKCQSLLQHNATEIKNIGLIPNVKHDIVLNKNEIIQCKPFRIPFKYKEKMYSHIKDLLMDKIIKKSNSNFSSPAFPIIKKNGEIRLIIDYRKLNQATQEDYYLFPKVWDILFQLRGSTVFSKLDLKSGYYQIALNPRCTQYTAFIIENEKYEWIRMPFGLSNAPKTFQKAMDMLFSSLTYVKVYLDDIIIHSENIGKHEQHLENVLSIINNNNIKINIEKSEFFVDKIRFLGHKISNLGISADRSHLEKFTLRTPKNKKGIQRILGFLTYFKTFIRNFSTKTLFLTDLLKKEAKIKWTSRHEKLLQEIFDEIKNSPILTYPDINSEFNLETDASDRAIGSVLKQNNNIIGFYSHKFSDTELKYTTMEKEALGILKSLEYFRDYIIGSKIIIFTDNKNLIFESSMSKRVQRWKLLLEEYNYEIRIIPGNKNVIADAISRITYLQTPEDNCYWNCEKLKQLQKNNIENIKKECRNWIYNEKDDVFTDVKNRIILNRNAIMTIMTKLHHDLAHPGSKKLYHTVKDYIYANNLKRIIDEITANCVKCQKNKENKFKYGKYAGFSYSQTPFKMISSDIFGPVKTSYFKTNSKYEYFYLITITDICSRFTRVFLQFDIKANSLIKCLNSWLVNYPRPKDFLSDMGRQYTSKELNKYFEKHKIHHIKTSPYNPTCNGISERINYTIKNILRIYKGEPLTKIIERIEVNINFSYHSILKASPIEMLNGYSFFDPFKRNLRKKLIKNKADEKIFKENEIIKKNKKRIDIKIKKDDLVLRRNLVQDKIQDRYVGPFKVVRVDESIGNVWVDEGRRVIRHNVKNIKPFFGGGECRAPDRDQKSFKYQKPQFINKKEDY